MPNPWDVGSAKLLASLGFEALATTSQGFAWAIGKLDQTVTRDELVAHVAAVAEATPLPLNVDSERLYPDDPGGIAETVRLLAEAGAAGCSIEDYDPATGRVDDVGAAAERVAIAAEGRRGRSCSRRVARATSTAPPTSTTPSRASSPTATQAPMRCTRPGSRTSVRSRPWSRPWAYR